jgi:hypothetical protein
MLRQPPVAARVRVSATIVFLLLVTAPLTALGQSTGDFIPDADGCSQQPTYSDLPQHFVLYPRGQRVPGRRERPARSSSAPPNHHYSEVLVR